MAIMLMLVMRQPKILPGNPRRLDSSQTENLWSYFSICKPTLENEE